MSMDRFSLNHGLWYAAELIGEEFGTDIRSYSPIRVQSVTAQGGRKFSLAFYHANYPEGVRDKVYDLETIERNRYFVLARSRSHDPWRTLLIYNVTIKWLVRHFGIVARDTDDPQSWLTRNA